MKAVITVIGQDTVGIIAGVSTLLSENKINILDISQTIMQNMFCMIMLVDFSGSDASIAAISEKLDRIGEKMGLSIHVQREELFQSMHRI